MSVIGLDFGSHTGSIALWFEEKNSVDVIADDLGSRTIPTSVAYRGDEVLTGSGAVSQQHKNPSNTFEDVRALLVGQSGGDAVNVPALEKEVTVQELSSHWFRNIHNQIKQQVGKVVRECVISLPEGFDEGAKQRLVESAQAGGVRLKCMIGDASAALLAYGFDDASQLPAKVAVVDIGWSSSQVAIYDVSGGLFFPQGSATSQDISGKVVVQLMADHCAKDFQRKSKMACTDSSKSMMRLRRECETAMKSMSTGAEATIDIDSLFEGVDYSSKLTRARFEDLISIPVVHLKKLVESAAAAAGVEPAAVTQICLAGGLCAIPKVQSTIKAAFPSAAFAKGRFEPAEAQCIGAALHGKHLLLQGLIDKAPTGLAHAAYITQPIYLSTGAGGVPACVLPAGSVVPAKVAVKAAVPQAKGHFQVLVGAPLPAPPAAAGKSLVSFMSAAFGGAGSAAVTDANAVGEVVFALPADVAAAIPADGAPVTVTVAVSKEAGLAVEVVAEDGTVLASLQIPSA
jgi:L1 cell adhesion molecule like protein